MLRILRCYYVMAHCDQYPTASYCQVDSEFHGFCPTYPKALPTAVQSTAHATKLYLLHKAASIPSVQNQGHLMHAAPRDRSKIAELRRGVACGGSRGKHFC